MTVQMLSTDDFAMKISILASGSSGNTSFIETPKRKILVDAGLSGKKIENLMKSINRSVRDVDAIFVSHEHSDHIKGLGVLARRYGMDIYANQDTWSAIGDKCGEIDFHQKRIIETGEMITLGDLDIMSFGVSHDAAKPQFYGFQRSGKQFVMLTDTGYVSERLRGLLNNSTAYLIESNHDLDMLRYGSYPWHLKQRILGDEGHLSNIDGAMALAEMIGDNTKHVFLGHLSKDNNMVDLANSTVCQILKEEDCGVNITFDVRDTSPEEATSLLTL